ncbi:Calcineurin OS=Streptomyces rimosus subsp. rimosus (strain ATCC / DSM 40260 / JCM 4667/ NRRL 2234) OX=1265868 GN=SRIM_035225 PE=4 SV=1 [Streptomyces rimosus subsp. rimosus]
MREQRRWLDTALRASRARWKVVLGHHPYLNNGKHGSAGSYDGFVIGHYTSGVHLKELYEEVVCGRADVIMSGHDHTLQILEPTDRTRGTRQLVPCRLQDRRRHGALHPPGRLAGLLPARVHAAEGVGRRDDDRRLHGRRGNEEGTTRPPHADHAAGVAAGVPVGAPAGVR